MGTVFSKLKPNKCLGINTDTVTTLSDYLSSGPHAAVQCECYINGNFYDDLLKSTEELDNLVKESKGKKIEHFTYKLMVVNPEWLWAFPVESTNECEGILRKGKVRNG